MQLLSGEAGKRCPLHQSSTEAEGKKKCWIISNHPNLLQGKILHSRTSFEEDDSASLTSHAVQGYSICDIVWAKEQWFSPHKVSQHDLSWINFNKIMCLLLNYHQKDGVPAFRCTALGLSGTHAELEGFSYFFLPCSGLSITKQRGLTLLCENVLLAQHSYG